MRTLLTRYLVGHKNSFFKLSMLIGVMILSTQSVNAQTGVAIPNVFTPNNDNVNDEFVIKPNGITVTDYNIKIYNRWGSLMFSSQNINISWDGRTTAGVKVSEGIYYYIISLNNTEYKGELSLIY
jgi:gliding motility-associated-like protein